MAELSTWDEVEAYIESIPQQVCGGTQLKFLYDLSLNTTGNGEIVEIGTNVGKSTIALSYAQKSKNGKSIHTIDIYQHPDIEKNLEGAGVTDFVIRSVVVSSKAASTWQDPIELLWIDGDHASYGVNKDIKHWAKHVVPGGKIAFHDYPGHNSHYRWTDEVWKAINRQLFRYPWQWRVCSDREAGSIIVFEKLAISKEKTPITAKIKTFLYWRFRNLVSRIFHYFPSFSSKLVQRKLAKKYGTSDKSVAENMNKSDT